MDILKEHFGILPFDKEAGLFTLSNNSGMKVQISNYGGTIISMLVPDKKGVLADVVLGYADRDNWIENAAYFNCIIGRTCNRIKGASFKIEGTIHKVSTNFGEMQLHGGFKGFSHRLWEASMFQNEDEARLVLEYLSADGEEGFPGNLKVKAIYTLNNTNELSLVLFATTDKSTPINLTNHAYFNLKGEGRGDVYSHILKIFADKITLTDSDSIPTGEFGEVNGTAYDFREPHRIGERIDELYKGYDNNYVLHNQTGQLSLAAKVIEPETGRVLEVLTTEPGVQLYTSNWFDGSMIGKCGKPHLSHTAICLETQHYPDSMNRPEFPDVILRPGQEYYSKTVWRFSNE